MSSLHPRDIIEVGHVVQCSKNGRFMQVVNKAHGFVLLNEYPEGSGDTCSWGRFASQYRFLNPEQLEMLKALYEE